MSLIDSYDDAQLAEYMDNMYGRAEVCRGSERERVVGSRPVGQQSRAQVSEDARRPVAGSRGRGPRRGRRGRLRGS